MKLQEESRGHLDSHRVTTCPLACLPRPFPCVKEDVAAADADEPLPAFRCPPNSLYNKGRGMTGSFHLPVIYGIVRYLSSMAHLWHYLLNGFPITG